MFGEQKSIGPSANKFVIGYHKSDAVLFFFPSIYLGACHPEFVNHFLYIVVRFLGAIIGAFSEAYYYDTGHFNEA